MEEEEKGKAQKSEMVEQCKELIISLSLMGMKKGQKKKEGKKGEGRPRARQVLEKFGKWLFLFPIVGQNWPCVSAAAEGQQRRTEAMESIQQEPRVKGGRWMEEIPQRWKRPEGGDRTEMKEAKLWRCTLLNGSAWSTERKYMRRYRRKCDIFFGMEHRIRQEELEEQFDREAKEGWRIAADAARVTDERAGIEDEKHISGGFFAAIDSNLGAVVGERRRSSCINPRQ